jgi:hypothetical protein
MQVNTMALSRRANHYHHGFCRTTEGHIHQVWPHYVAGADGKFQLYLLVHGWNLGKFAVLKHVPNY